MPRLLINLLPIVLILLVGCDTSNSGSFILDSQPPQIVFAGVTEGGIVSGLINIAASAEDHFGLESFLLRLDGAQVATGIDGALTYAWNTTTATNGAHTLEFVAKDNSNNTTTETVHVTVTNGGGGDVVDPVIAVTGIANNATVSGTVAIHATATDNVGVASFTLKRDGASVAVGVGGAIDYAWNTALIANGAHVLLFEASDAAGNTAATTLDVTVNNGGGGAGVIGGKVFAQNGVDPVAGALVYVPTDGNSAGSETVVDDGTAPSDPHLAYAYSQADGSFSLTGVPVGAQLVIIIKGGFHKFVNLTVAAGTNNLSASDTTLPVIGGAGGSVPQIAVVTGDYDHIQNVLAKMGLGDVDTNGELVPDTEHFLLIDGNDSLPNTTTHPNFDVFFSAPANLAPYGILFINCGNSFEDWFFSTPTAVAGLKNWVEAGGRLYCSDWSYDFVEQLWSDRIDFYGDTGTDGLSTTPEMLSVAQLGANMASLDATVLDTDLKAWLGLASINALNGNQTVTVVDWLPGWAVQVAVAPSVKTWVEGSVVAASDPEAVAPLTVSFQAGSGKVLYSSYHTEETPSAAFTGNDRVLEYLLFEVLY